MHRRAVALCCGAMIGFFAAPMAAQTLEQICPGATEGIGALFGTVTDADAEMVLAGASVIASWDTDGQEQSAEAQVGAEGLYAMCLPRQTQLSLYASFATASGEPLDLVLSEEFTRQDLSLSMASGAAGSDDRLWLCMDGGQSLINDRFARLVRCDEEWQPLERCPKEELGRVTVQPIGAGSGMLRDMIERLVQEAKRLGANAVVNLQDGRGGLSFIGTTHMTAITAEAVLIEVDPRTCR